MSKIKLPYQRVTDKKYILPENARKYCLALAIALMKKVPTLEIAKTLSIYKWEDGIPVGWSSEAIKHWRENGSEDTLNKVGLRYQSTDSSDYYNARRDMGEHIVITTYGGGTAHAVYVDAKGVGYDKRIKNPLRPNVRRAKVVGVIYSEELFNE